MTKLEEIAIIIITVVGVSGLGFIAYLKSRTSDKLYKYLRDKQKKRSWLYDQKIALIKEKEKPCMKVTKLEEEIKAAMTEAQWGLGAPEEVLRDIEARAAAEVAKKYIEKAWFNGACYSLERVIDNKMTASEKHYETYAKENGITE